MKDSPEQQPLKCLIVDDEQIAIKGIANHISKLDFLTVNAICSSALEARGILENQPIDLMFLDINMPYLSGIDFLKSLDEAPLTILTTAYSEYALEGYQLNVVDYLLKPISFQRFFQAVTKAAHSFRTQLLLQNNGIEETAREMYIRQGGCIYPDILERYTVCRRYAELPETALQVQNSHHPSDHDFTGRNSASKRLLQDTQVFPCKPLAHRFHRQRKSLHQRERTSCFSPATGGITANSSL